MPAELEEPDLTFLRRAIELAAYARSIGEQPYGSLLVSGTGEILAEAYNTATSDGDITAHPELKLGRFAGQLPTDQARASTLYTSCQPCSMCLGALLRGQVGHIVYALSEEQLQSLQTVSEHGAGPTLHGPALFDEAAAAVGDFYA